MYNSNSIKSRPKSGRIDPSGSCPQQHFYLSERGVRQAGRNNSNEIWRIFGNDPYGYIECQQQQYNKKTLDNTLDTSGIAGSTQKTSFKIDRPERGILKPQQNKQQTQNTIDNRSKAKSVSFNLGQQNSISKRDGSDNGKNENNRSKSKKKLTPQQQEMERLKRQKYLKQCYSINQFLKSNKAYTREMPNSTIKLMYQLPCLQAYGRSNTSGNNGFIYNDFMKTHNVLPHRLGNQPVKYQAYRSALNFCKRTKIDPEERWKKIHRQMRSKLNMKELVQYFSKGTIDVNEMNLQSVLKLDINALKGSQFKRSRSLTDIQKIPSSSHQVFNKNALNSTTKSNKLDLNTTKATDDLKESDRISELKRSKSWGKKQYLFLYKYTNKEGQTHYCKDRHGITCYVDPSFEENQEAYKKFLRRIKPIEAEDVREEDRNIDKLLVQNFIESKQQDLRKHYLLPNCEEPVAYNPQKYSIKARKQMVSSKVE